jgi:MFS family permease
MVFVGVMVLGSLMAAAFIVDPSKVIKEDGSRVVVRPPKTPREEFKDVSAVIFDRNMILLFLLFFGSNFFYTYQFDGVNGFMFNLRTRGLNASLYWGAQMIGAIVIGHVLDNKKYDLGKRALIGFTVLAIAINVFYGMGCFLEYNVLADFNKGHPFEPKIDFTEGRFAFPCIVFVLYGLGDSMIQAYAYWMMKAIAKDNTLLCARYTGYYKGVQSFGAAISWMLDIKQFNVAYIYQYWCCWILFVAALPSCLVVVRGIQKREEEVKPPIAAEGTDQLNATYLE